MQVTLYRGYAADQRLSMEIYANQLDQALGASGVACAQYTPISNKEGSDSNWWMRYLRYCAYPRQVRHLQSDVHHVVDHGYAHLYPSLTSGVSCVTVHDLIPLLTHKREIENDGKSRRPWLNQYSLRFVSKYGRVITPSRSTADDLQEHLAISPEQITVVPPIIGDHFQVIDGPAIKSFAASHQLVAADIWLMISGREFYKNHQTSLTVLRSLCDQGFDVRLLRTGVSSPGFSKVAEKLGVVDRITEIYLQSPLDLPLVYGFIDCLLFPSLYEGFGMPVAEALACGTPVVSSDRGSLPEIAPELVQHRDPFDVDALCSAVLTAVLQQAGCDEFQVSASKAVERYRKDAVTPRLMQLYAQLAANAV